MNRWWGSSADSAKQTADRNQRAQQRDQRAVRGIVDNLNLNPLYDATIKSDCSQMVLIQLCSKLYLRLVNRLL